MKRITGHLTEKKGKWYAVVNLYDTEGKRHEKWKSLDLEAKKGTKTEATHRLNQILEKYNSGNLYLHESLSRADRERDRIANMLVEDYLEKWLGHSDMGTTANIYSHVDSESKKMNARHKKSSTLLCAWRANCGQLLLWRRWRDLNSRYGYCRTTAFRVRTLQPLGYISVHITV